MIPKGGGTDFLRIGLVEVLWKAISGIINRQLLSSIQFHDALRGFCAGKGMGTATLEANLIQQLISIKETVLHAIFLDLRKACDALYRDHGLDILAGYGVGNRTLCILCKYWVQLYMVEKAVGHYETNFQSHCKVTQGYLLSPAIFNVGVDAVIRHWVTVVEGGGQEGAGQEGLVTSIHALSEIFYVDVGIIASHESARLQGAFDALTGLFYRVGLQINEGKMGIMACQACHTPHT